MPIASQRTGTDQRAALLPPELLPVFDDRFVHSSGLLEEYVARLALAIFASLGLDRVCTQEASALEAVHRAGLAPVPAERPVAWLLATLAARGWLTRTAGPQGELRYRLSGPLPRLDPDQMLHAQEAHDPRCLPSYRIAALAAERYPSVLRAEQTGEQALFGPDGISTWVKYFSNDNPLYAVSNAVGAIAVQRSLPPGEINVLEIGGGLGSGAQALLDRLIATGRAQALGAYRFTEISPLFLKRAQRILGAGYPQCPLSFAALDLDQPLERAGVPPGSCTLVYGVNVLHVARDLGASLAQLRRALKPGGILVMAECVRPFAGMPVHLELVFGLLPAFRDAVLVPGWRPNPGFLTPEQWCAALEANGFVEARAYPDIAAIREDYPGFVVAAIIGRRP
jgi:SAM-dependent methyltransferase